MCTPAIGNVVGRILQPIIPALPTPPEVPPRQNAKKPSWFDMRREITRGAIPSSTLLTGSKGISPDSLNVGKSTLLGG